MINGPGMLKIILLLSVLCFLFILQTDNLRFLVSKAKYMHYRKGFQCQTQNIQTWYILVQPFQLFNFTYILLLCYLKFFPMNSRLKWTIEEEQLLKSLVASGKKNKWTYIAKIINQKIPNFNRTPKQCREKYNNYLIFNQNACDINWAPQELQLLFKEYRQKGSKWKLISESFQRKSQNTIKNKFYGNVRKLVRKLNKVRKQRINKSVKPIRQKSIIRIIEPEIDHIHSNEQTVVLIKKLRQKLLDLIQNGNFSDFDCPSQKQDDVKDEDMLFIIKQIHKFNSRCRFYIGRKIKNSSSSEQQNYFENQQEDNQEQEKSNESSQIQQGLSSLSKQKLLIENSSQKPNKGSAIKQTNNFVESFQKMQFEKVINNLTQPSNQSHRISYNEVKNKQQFNKIQKTQDQKSKRYGRDRSRQNNNWSRYQKNPAYSESTTPRKVQILNQSGNVIGPLYARQLPQKLIENNCYNVDQELQNQPKSQRRSIFNDIQEYLQKYCLQKNKDLLPLFKVQKNRR